MRPEVLDTRFLGWRDLPWLMVACILIVLVLWAEDEIFPRRLR